jgi:hypothetical protein
MLSLCDWFPTYLSIFLSASYKKFSVGRYDMVHCKFKLGNLHHGFWKIREQIVAITPQNQTLSRSVPLSIGAGLGRKVAATRNGRMKNGFNSEKEFTCISDHFRVPDQSIYRDGKPNN